MIDKNKKNIKIPRNIIKEAFDNLPSGACYFNKKGRLILCNKKMFELCFKLTNRELQVITDLQSALNNDIINSNVTKQGDYYFFPDGTVWSFTCKMIEHDDVFTEYIASNVTDLYKKKEELRKSTIEREEMGSKMRQISNNIVAITREEEILAMKMLVHNKVGEVLQRLRYYKANDLLFKRKDELANVYEDVVKLLKGEIENNDDTDDLSELLRVGRSLGLEIVIEGIIPIQRKTRDIIIMCLRETMTNTIRHGKGNRLVLVINDNDEIFFSITNNGIVPSGEIVEGGGLTSLRQKIELAGGKMKIDIKNEFMLSVKLPKGDK